MYKILCFGLFLIGSLLMSALTLNVNLLSNAMAQGYDIYRDNGYYSQYPTDDKKYECRTGPFEGFFVSSVEFCKHIKFDDKKDKSTEIIEQEHKVQPGPEGPAGHSRSSKGYQEQIKVYQVRLDFRDHQE